MFTLETDVMKEFFINEQTMRHASHFLQHTNLRKIKTKNRLISTQESTAPTEVLTCDKNINQAQNCTYVRSFQMFLTEE